jgi:hypothetical protein
MWVGPALAGLFGLAVVVLLALANASPLARWTLADALAPERVLPIIGLGVLFGLVGIRTFAAAFLLFAFGIIAGLIAEDWLLRLLDVVPNAATHLFLTGPISYLAVGVALAAAAWRRAVLAPIAALVYGTMLGLVIRLTDPSLHEPAYTWTPVLIAAWIIVAVSLTISAFYRGWFLVFGRIFGSWLLAIGLLYGGAMLATKRQPRLTPPPSNFDRSFPDIGRPQDQPSPDALPGTGRFGLEPDVR